MYRSPTISKAQTAIHSHGPFLAVRMYRSPNTWEFKNTLHFNFELRTSANVLGFSILPLARRANVSQSEHLEVQKHIVFYTSSSSAELEKSTQEWSA